jgi:hypothetical protein
MMEDAEQGRRYHSCWLGATELAYESSAALRGTLLPVHRPFFSGDYTTKRPEMHFLEEFA